MRNTSTPALTVVKVLEETGFNMAGYVTDNEEDVLCLDSTLFIAVGVSEDSHFQAQCKEEIEVCTRVAITFIIAPQSIMWFTLDELRAATMQVPIFRQIRVRPGADAVMDT